MKQKLEGVPETLLVTLWARAVEAEQDHPIFKDSKAMEMMGQIDYNFHRFDEEWPTQVSVAVRTEILDNAVKAFINSHPEGVIVNLGCGLDTRYYRLNNGTIRWYDLDLPEVIAVREKFFTETSRYKMLAKPFFDYTWMDEVKKDKPFLIIAEGLLMYFRREEVKELLGKLVDSFPGGEMLMETIPPALVKQAEKQDLVKKQYQIDAHFQWGIKKGKDMEKLNGKIKFVEEWHYFNHHKERWRSIRWLSLIPTFKNRFGNRVVHLKFLD